MKHGKKTYPLRLIKENYTYTVEQIAELFGLNSETVLRWIRNEGLERIPQTRPYLVHSKPLKRFLEKKQKARKHTCNVDEAYCMKCRKPRKPKINSGNATHLPNKTVRFQGRCETCSSKINRSIKAAEWTPQHPFASYLHDALKQHDGEPLMPLKSSIQKGEQLCLNITPKMKN
nr:helix-turn-helix domain-containing protein [Cytophagales bacterium]